MARRLPLRDADGDVLPGLTLGMVRALVVKTMFPSCSIRQAAAFAGVSETAIRLRWLSKPAFRRLWDDRSAAYLATRDSLLMDGEIRSMMTLMSTLDDKRADIRTQVDAAGKFLDYSARVRRREPPPRAPQLLPQLPSGQPAVIDAAVVRNASAVFALPAPALSEVERDSQALSDAG